MSSQELSAEELAEYDSDRTRKGDPSKPLLWHSGDATKFRTRIGPNYKKHKKKDLSAPALYDCVGVEVLKDEVNQQIITEYASKVPLPSPRPGDNLDAIEKSGLPRILLVNVQIPYARVAMFGKTPVEHGCSLIFIFAVKPETVQEALGENPRPAVSLLRRFAAEWNQDPEIRRRMKALATCDNLSQLGFRGVSIYKRYNGKPVIINKTGTWHQEKTEYLELEARVREFKFATLKGLDAFRDHLLDMFLNVAFVIQSEDDSEQPEIIFGCANLRNLDLEKAKQVEYAI